MNQSNPWSQPSQPSNPPAQGFPGAQAPPPGAWGPPPQQVTQPASGPGQLPLFPDPTAETPPPTPPNSPPYQQPQQPAGPQQSDQAPVAPQPAQAPPQSAPQQPPMQVQQPALQQQEAVMAAGELKDIPVLLREFAKRERCDRYSSDSEKIKLIIDYLWLRQLTPTLMFETFLDLYAAVADFDDTNLKHPADAIKELLPRTKSQAEKKGVRQWSAKEVSEYLTLYIDIVRAAEVANNPVPVTLNQFLENNELREKFLQGVFKSEHKASPAKPQTTKKPKNKDDVERPTAAGQRTIMTHPSGRQYRGYITEIWSEGEAAEARTYANFKADSGEEFQGTAILKFEKIDDPPPHVPADDNTDQAKPEVGNKTMLIKKAEYTPAKAALELAQPMGNVAIGDNIYNWYEHFDDGYTAVVCIVNGETRPYVDAFLCQGDASNIIAEIPPREQLVGTYQFEAPHGVYTLEVRGNE